MRLDQIHLVLHRIAADVLGIAAGHVLAVGHKRLVEVGTDNRAGRNLEEHHAGEDNHRIAGLVRRIHEAGESYTALAGVESYIVLVVDNLLVAGSHLVVGGYNHHRPVLCIPASASNNQPQVHFSGYPIRIRQTPRPDPVSACATRQHRSRGIRFQILSRRRKCSKPPPTSSNSSLSQ